MGGAKMRTRETKKLMGQHQLGTPWTRQKPRGMQVKTWERQRQVHRCDRDNDDRDNTVRRKESQPGDGPSVRAGETQEIVSTQLS